MEILKNLITWCEFKKKSKCLLPIFNKITPELHKPQPHDVILIAIPENLVFRPKQIFQVLCVSDTRLRAILTAQVSFVRKTEVVYRGVVGLQSHCFVYWADELVVAY